MMNLGKFKFQLEVSHTSFFFLPFGEGEVVGLFWVGGRSGRAG